MSFTESYPFDNTPVATELQWEQMARHWSGDGPLRWWDNQLEPFGDSSGRQVKVRNGQAFVRGTYGRMATETTLAIAANTSGNPRIDLVVIRRNVSTNTLVLAVVQGTPGVSPAVPALTQNATVWEVPLARVAVANGASTITAGNVTDVRLFRGPWHMPWGAIGVGAVVASQTGIGTAITDVTGVTVSWNAVANRFYRASFTARLDSNHGAVNAAQAMLRDQADNVTARSFVSLAANPGPGDQATAAGVWVGTRTAGPQTLKLSVAFTAGTGNSVFADANEGAFLIVEDIGPSGAPS